MRAIGYMSILILAACTQSEHAQEAGADSTADSAANSPASLQVDLLLTNGRIFTVDEAQPWAEAMAVRAGRIVALGSAQALSEYQPDALLDLNGRMVMPGINDTHIHPLWGGVKELYECTFAFTASPEAIATAISECVTARPDQAWITGGQWGSDFFTQYDVPSPRDFLDALSGTHAIALTDDSGHNMWVNSKALALAAIGRDSPDPEGGTIDRDELGHPTGLLMETAGQLVNSVLPVPSDAQYVAAAARSVAIANAYGITGMKDAGAFRPAPRAYHALDQINKLTMHVATCLRTPYGHREGDLDFVALVAERAEFASTNVHTGFVKLFLDGVPTAARTAAMLKPYAAHGNFAEGFAGELHLSPSRLRADVIELDRLGFTIKMHAAGDRAVQVGLDAVAAARQANGGSGLRHELAHAGYIDEADIPRFAQLNVAADFSPYLWHPSPIIHSVVTAVGSPRGERYWPTRDLLDAGAAISIGSDWPAAVPNANPWVGLAALVTRTDPRGLTPGALWPEQAISLEEAIRIFTYSGAVGLGLENDTGTLEAGKFADFIVLDRDLFNVPVEAIGETQVAFTYFKGQRVFDRLGE